jgi:hypothetical protein
MQKKTNAGKVIYFKLLGKNHMEIITTGPIFVSNYELSRFKKTGKLV